jgi:hypothetical protein
MPQDDIYSEENQRSRRSERQRGGAQRLETPTEAVEAAAERMGQRSEIGTENMKNGLRMQREMFDTLQEIGREWLVRATSGAELALSLPSKVSAARTPADALSAYQEWLNEWMQMRADDGFRAMSDGRRIIDTGMRCFSGGPTGVSS